MGAVPPATGSFPRRGARPRKDSLSSGPVPLEREQRGIIAGPPLAGSHESVGQPADGLRGWQPSALVAWSISRNRALPSTPSSTTPSVNSSTRSPGSSCIDRGLWVSAETERAGHRAGELTDDPGAADPQRRRVADVDPGPPHRRRARRLPAGVGLWISVRVSDKVTVQHPTHCHGTRPSHHDNSKQLDGASDEYRPAQHVGLVTGRAP
jgi:hypothetical protein